MILGFKSRLIDSPRHKKSKLQPNLSVLSARGWARDSQRSFVSVQEKLIKNYYSKLRTINFEIINGRLALHWIVLKFKLN